MIKIKNNVNSAIIELYGTIVDDTDANWLLDENGNVLGYQFPAKIKEELEAIKNLPVLVKISSYGGDVSAAVAIFNMLSQHEAPVTVQIDSIAASSASLIAFAGSEIIMPENTFIMVHNPSGGGFGTADYLLSIVDYLDKIKEMIASTYEKHVKNGTDIRKLMDAETWITAKEASEMFDNVKLVESTGVKAVAKFDVEKLSSYKNIPEEVKEMLKVEDNTTDNNTDNATDDDINNEIKNKILSVLEDAYDEKACRIVTED